MSQSSAMARRRYPQLKGSSALKMCVDLVCAKPAPLACSAASPTLAGVRHEAAASPCPAGTAPRLRLFGNVRVGEGREADITARELSQLAVHCDRRLLP